MADSETSQFLNFSNRSILCSQVASMRNISTLLLVNSDDEAAILPPDQDTGVRDENMQHAHTCFVPAKARLVPAKSWKDVLDSQNNRQNECLGVAFVIKFASSDIARPDSGTFQVEGYVHDDEKIRLKRWQPMNHSDLSELLQTSSPHPSRRRCCGCRRL